MTGLTWVSAHIVRHDHLDPLLARAVGPFAERLCARGSARRFFFLRYWEGGPHLRLRLLVPATAVPAVHDEIMRDIGGYLRRQPSRYRVDPSEYAALAARIGAFEGRDEYETKMFDADTVVFRRYPPEFESFGTGLSLAAVERHFEQSSRIAIAMAQTARERRTSVAFAMLLGALQIIGAAGPTVATSIASFDVDEANRTWQATRGRLLATARQLSELSPGGPVGAWLHSLRTLRAALTGLNTGRTDPVGHALRRCLHLHLNRLGMEPAREARLHHMATLTLEDMATGAPNDH